MPKHDGDEADTGVGDDNGGQDDDDDDEEEDDEDDEEFYTTNPVDAIKTADMSGPSKFDDFDDFDALGLNSFYGKEEKRLTNSGSQKTKAVNKPPLQMVALWVQRPPAEVATSSVEEATRRKRPKGNKRRGKTLELDKTKREGKRRKRRKRRKKGKLELKLAEATNTTDDLQRPTKAEPPFNQPTLAPRSAAASDERERQTSASGSPQNVNLGCAMVSKNSGACIDYQSVERALEQARRLIAFRRPPGLNSLEPAESTVHAIGELSEWTSRLLAMRFGLTSDEVADSMDQIDVSQTSLWRWCPRIFRTPWARPCDNYNDRANGGNARQQLQLDPDRVALTSGRYRSLTGQCNNPLTPNLGSSFMPFVRLNMPDYGDGIGSSRRPRSGLAELPPARLVSLMLHSNPLDVPSSDLSAMFASWGQLINHDLALASGARVATGHDQSCCLGGERQLQLVSPLGRVCMPIYVAQEDPVYGPHRIRCLDFKRSIAGLRPGCSFGPRTQLNLVSSFVDGSFVYGSTRTTGTALRTSSANRGQMAVWNYFGRTTNSQGVTIQRKPLLPPQREAPDDECLGRRDGFYCFRSGDSRTNQQVPLVVLHTIHTRQHNRIARALDQINPHWSAERIYQEARHIHIAQIQHILMREYLPLVLGTKTRTKFDLLDGQDGEYWDHYEPRLNPGISQEFAAAAFRQGHSTVAGEVYRLDVLSRLPRRVYRLRELFRQPWPLFEPGAVDEFLLGLTESASREMDPFVSQELGGHLLQEPNEPIGLDLIAINIQRGRDQGLAGYNAMRAWCGLGRLDTLEQLVLAVGNQSAHLMMQLYQSIDDIDLYSGGLSEFPTESGSLLGPTFSCIVAQQFSQLRQGDRYWYESSGGPHAFTPEQLASIRETTLARIVCANSDEIYSIQPMAMRLPHPIYNPTLNCQELPDLDMSLWVDFARPVGQQVQQAGADGDEV